MFERRRRRREAIRRARRIAQIRRDVYYCYLHGGIDV